VLVRSTGVSGRCECGFRNNSHFGNVLSDLSETLPGLSPVFPVTLKASRNALLQSYSLLKLTHQSLHSIFSKTLLEASGD
jgi:hypothetical protein